MLANANVSQSTAREGTQRDDECVTHTKMHTCGLIYKYVKCVLFHWRENTVKMRLHLFVFIL